MKINQISKMNNNKDFSKTNYEKMNSKQNNITFQQSATKITRNLLVTAPFVFAALLPQKAHSQVMNNVQTETTTEIAAQNGHSIESLVPIAKNYISDRSVDENKNGIIDGNREIDILLAGTCARTIEDLTFADIQNKIAEQDIKNVFITLMATEDKVQADINEKILRANIQLISKAYDNIDKSFANIADTTAERYSFNIIDKIIYKENLKPEDVNKLISHLTNIRGAISCKKYALDAINEEYKKITDQDFPVILRKKERLDAIENQLLEQIEQLSNGYIPNEQTKNEFEKARKQLITVFLEISKLRKQYTNQGKRDVEFCDRLHKERIYFSSDYSIHVDKTAKSEDLLSEAYRDITPMTIDFIMNRAKKAYNPAHNPITGIHQNNTQKLPKRSYKTPKKIMIFDGKKYIEKDYRGISTKNKH